MRSLARLYPATALGLVAATALAARTGAAAGGGGEIAIINGHVFTHAAGTPPAVALLIRDGKFALVGSRDDVIKAARPGTPVIDLGGWVVYPGFHDSHSRLGECGPEALEVPLGDAAGPTGLAAALHDSLPRAPRGGWLLGTDWDPRAARGTRATLDSVSTSTPILVRTRDGHAVWLNSRGLDALGLKPDARDPDDGWFERDAAGRLNGVCFEGAAFQVIERWVSSASVEQVAACIEQNIQAAARRGVVSFHDASPYARSAQAFALLARRGRLKARVLQMPMPQLPDGYAEWTRLRSPDPERLALGPDLVAVDGTLTAGTAAVGRPYRSVRDSGYALVSQGRLDSLARAAVAGGRGVSLHASGDRGVRMAVDALERAAAGGTVRGELRLERADLVQPQDAARFRKLGATFVLLPWQLPQDIGPGTVEDTTGAAPRVPHPIRSLASGGTPLVIGTDATPGNSPPGLALQRAMNPPNAAELPAPQLILHGLTVTPARSAHEDAVGGTIEVGKRADLVVVDRDPLRVPSQLVPAMKALLVISNGEIVHRLGI